MTDPLWKKVVGGFIGLGIGIAFIWLSREGGVSAAEVEEWQLAIVLGAAAAGVVLWLVMRQRSK